MSQTPWDILALAPTADQVAIRRAYARRLKVTNPEDDPDGFQALRQAYEDALLQARRQAPDESVAAAEEPSPPAETPAAEGPPEEAPAVDEAVVRHIALCNHLGDLLSTPRGTEPANLMEALRAVLASPALGHIDIQNRTEDWLARLLLSTAPRSDELVPIAIAHFHWDRVKAGEQTQLLAAVQKRGRDLAFLTKLQGRDHTYATAYRLLRAPPRRRSPGLRLALPDRIKDVRALLTLIRTDYATLRLNFDAQTLAAWDDFLTAPHFNAGLLWTLLTAPLFLALYLHIRATLPPDDPSVEPMHLLLLPPALAAAGAVYQLGIRLPARWLAQWLARQTPSRVGWFSLGWLPAGLALTVAATALPVNGVSLVGALALSLGLLWWAAVSQLAGSGDRLPTAGLSLLINAIPLAAWLVWTAPNLPTEAPQQMALAATLGAVVLGGTQAARGWMERLTPAWRRASLWLLALGALGASAALWLSLSHLALVPWAITAVACVQSLDRIPSLLLPGRLVKYRYYVLYAFGAVLQGSSPWVAGMTEMQGILVFGGLALTTSVGVTVARLLRSDHTRPA
ncbi:J domain-containing protein [Nitrospirillum iridis]|uniref:J domain-containing protein n=1 Tax=Nitrospirillum iridis TaxID=765888 RepID=A0A7X0EBU9_9PROT|nr:J domain-containing protein [Nitrospirillum iridis]MBB6250470.1 hypothetical protein [Nitrospirillum iridis]